MENKFSYLHFCRIIIFQAIQIKLHKNCCIQIVSFFFVPQTCHFANFSPFFHSFTSLCSFIFAYLRVFSYPVTCMKMWKLCRCFLVPLTLCNFDINFFFVFQMHNNKHRSNLHWIYILKDIHTYVDRVLLPFQSRIKYIDRTMKMP